MQKSNSKPQDAMNLKAPCFMQHLISHAHKTVARLIKEECRCDLKKLKQKCNHFKHPVDRETGGIIDIIDETTAATFCGPA